MRISDWSSDVCSSDLRRADVGRGDRLGALDRQRQSGDGDDVRRVERADAEHRQYRVLARLCRLRRAGIAFGRVRLRALRSLWQRAAVDRRGRDDGGVADDQPRSEEHTSELQSLMRISYSVFCLKTQTKNTDIVSN